MHGGNWKILSEVRQIARRLGAGDWMRGSLLPHLLSCPLMTPQEEPAELNGKNARTFAYTCS